MGRLVLPSDGPSSFELARMSYHLENVRLCQVSRGMELVMLRGNSSRELPLLPLVETKRDRS